MNKGSHNKVVFTGICCLDIVSYLNGFPVEDSDLRNVDQLFTLGGNATNSCKVATQLNHHSFLYSAIPDRNPLFDNIFEQFGVDTSMCVIRRGLTAAGKDGTGAENVPITIVLVNQQNGSRTMFSSLGGREWPRAEDFKRKFPSLEEFGWFHFEVTETIGLDQIFEMIEHVHSLRGNSDRPVISIELEHNVKMDWLRKLIPLADLIFTSKDFAQHFGWLSMRDVAEQFQEKFDASHATIVCPWGEKGVASKSGSSPRLQCAVGTIVLPGHQPSGGAVIDTLAAGDCFIAGVVHFLNEKQSLDVALAKATFLAGESVGQRGLHGLTLPHK